MSKKVLKDKISKVNINKNNNIINNKNNNIINNKNNNTNINIKNNNTNINIKNNNTNINIKNNNTNINIKNNNTNINSKHNNTNIKNEIINTIEEKYTIQNIKINYNGSRKNKYNDLKNLSNPLSQFERKVASSIYEKYFKNNSSLENNNKSQIDKKQFMKKIFMIKDSIHTNIDELKIELENIEKANKAYESNPNLYKNKKTEYGYPDKYRCLYVRYEKHKYFRCKCGISEKDPDKTFCSRHYLLDNHCINEYLKLKSQIKSSINKK